MCDHLSGGTNTSLIHIVKLQGFRLNASFFVPSFLQDSISQYRMQAGFTTWSTCRCWITDIGQHAQLRMLIFYSWKF